jgi:uncharacterized protein (TIGR02266 family)
MVDYSSIPRDSRRVPIATKVQFKFDRFSGFISEYSSNISPTGMFIVTENPEPPGRILDLEFRLGDGFEIIKGQGEVVWVRALPDGPSRPPGMGIRFTELSPGSHDLIYRIVDRFVAQGGTPFDLAMRHAPPDDSAAPAAPPAPEPLLPPLSLEPDPFPELEGRDSAGTVLPWSPTPKETLMAGGDVLPPLEPLDEIFHLEEVPASPAPAAAAPAAAAPKRAPSGPSVLPFQGSSPAEPLPVPANDPFPVPASDLDLTQAGPTVVGFDEPIPDPPSYPDSRSSSAGGLSGANDLFASYLPQPAAPPETPQVRPLSTLAGGASVQQPRRIFPLVLVAVLLAVAAAAFFLRDRISGWIGLGGGEEVVTAEQRPPLPRPAAPPPDSTLHEEVGGLTSDSSSDSRASTEVPAPAPAAPPEQTAPSPPAQAQAAPPAEPEPQRLPEVVQRKPAAPAGPAVTVVERITFEPAPGGTTVILWGNGAMRPESYKRIGVESPPREVIQLRGIQRPFAPVRIPVGTAEVKQIRIGYHEKPGGNELHVVIDLAGSRVKAARVEPDGQRLRILLQAQ